MQNFQRVPPTSGSPLEDRSFESLYPPPGSSPGVGSSPESSSPSLSLTREEGDQPASPSKKYPDYCRTLQVRDSNGAVKELVFPKALDLDRPKRARTTFSAEQLYKLEREFQRNQYLVGRERTDLAHNLQLSETQVKVWFQNRRTKYKRDNSRQAEERKQHAEGMAACNIMRMLQQKPPAPPGSAPAPPHPPGPAPPRPPGPTPTSLPLTSLPPTSLPPTSLPPIPIAVSISNRPPLGSNVNPSILQGHSPLQAHPSSRFHFPPPPHMAHMHNFAAGFYTS